MLVKMRMVVAQSRKLASNRHSSKSAHLSYYSLPSIQKLGRKLTGIQGPRRQKRCHMYSPDLWGGVDRPVARLQSNRTSRAPVGHFTARSPVNRRRSPAECTRAQIFGEARRKPSGCEIYCSGGPPSRHHPAGMLASKGLERKHKKRS
jgi:hypothetical protein